MFIPSANIGLSSPIKSRQKVLPKCVKKYQLNLKEMYVDMTPFLEEDFPDRVPQEDAKVVLIQDSIYDKDDMKSESLDYDHAHGKIDSIQAHKKEIDVSLILEPVPSMDKKEPRKAPKMLMDGAPGVGKTTLTLSACKGWAENRLFNKYDLVLLVPLRQSSCREAKSLIDLLPGDDPILKQEVVQYILKSSGENIAIVFDGYDELSYEQRRRESFFMKIFHGKILYKCAVWITSRPYTSGELLKLSSINRHVEILGFKKEQIYACVRKRIKDRDKASSLIRQLEEREDITSICYIPLLCVIMIRVYESNSGQSLPLTMTELFRRFLHDLVKRHLTVVNRDDRECDSDSEFEDERVSDPLKKLQCLAYKYFVQDKFVFSFKELKKVCGNGSDIKAHSLGLLTSSTNVSRDHEHEHFQFVHLSIQEYLAAKHFSESHKEDEVMDVLCQHIDEPRYRLFLLFLAGMTKLQNVTYLQIIFCLGWKTRPSTTVSDDYLWNVNKSNPFASRFMYCINLIFESACYDTFNYLFQSLPSKSEISLSNHTMTLFDCRILTHFLCHVENEWDYLDLQNCSLSVESLQVMSRVYKEYNCSKSSICHVDLSENDPEIFSNLCKFPWFDTLQTFTYIYTSHLDVYAQQKPIRSDLSHLAHIPTLLISFGRLAVDTSPSKVTLSHAILGERFIEYIKQTEAASLVDVDYRTVQMMLCSSFIDSLSTIEIKDVPGLDKLIYQTSKKISTSRCLQRLTLCNIGLTDHGTSQLLESLANNTSIIKLNLSSNPHALRKEIGHILTTMLSQNKVIQELTLCDTNIDDEVTEYLIAGLELNCSLKHLDVNGNVMSIQNSCSVITTTVRHSRLSQLKIGGIHLQRETPVTVWKLHDKGFIEPISPYGFCVISELQLSYGNVVKYKPHYLKSISISSSSEYETSISDSLFLKYLQRDQSIFNLSMCGVNANFTNGCESMLTANDTLQKISFVDCSFSESALIFLEAGLAKNLSLRKLSLTHCKEASVVICVLRALQQNRSIEHVELSDNGSSLTLCHDDQLIAASTFERLLCDNSVLLTIDMSQTSLSDGIAQGIANGLKTNKSLKTLKISSTMLTSCGIKAILHSSTSSGLRNFDICKHYYFSRTDRSCWDLVVEKVYPSWPQLGRILREENVTSIQIKKYGLCIHQAERMLLSLSELKTLKVLNLQMHTRECDGSRNIGVPLQRLLKNSHLDVLVLSESRVTHDAWRLVAEGLSMCSLKRLDVSKCALTVSEAVSIFTNLNVEELNISDNTMLADINERTSELCDAIQNAIACTTSRLKYMNLKNSINDSIAKAIADTLQTTKVTLERMEISEDHLSCGVIQQFLRFMVESQSSLTQINFTTNKLGQSCHQDFLFNMVTSVKGTNYSVYRPSAKLFCGMCNAAVTFIAENETGPNHLQPFLNITSVNLDDIDADATIVLFRSLTHLILSKVKKLKLKAKDDYAHKVVGQPLKVMLESNTILEEFSFENIGVALVPMLTDGIKANHHLKEVDLNIVKFDSVNERVLAELMKAIDSSRSLQCLNISCLHQLVRNHHFYWCCDHEDSDFESRLNRSSFPLQAWFICSLSNICMDLNLASSAAYSILMSCTALKVESNNTCVDGPLLIKMFDCMKCNSTLTELDLSGLSVLSENTDRELCAVIESMFSENKSLKVLNLTYALNDDIAKALVAGLESNQFPRHLQIDAKSLRLGTLSRLLHLLETNSLESLTVADVVSIKHGNDANWQVNVVDDQVWIQMLSALHLLSPEDELWNTLKSHTKRDIVHKDSPIGDNKVHNIGYCSPYKELPKLDSVRVTLSPRICEIKCSSNPTVQRFDLENCHSKSALITSAINSLQESDMLDSLVLQISDDFEDFDIGRSIAILLKKCSVLRCIDLSGTICDSHIQSVLTTLKATRSCCVIMIRAEVGHLCVDSVVGLMQLFDDTNILDVVLCCCRSRYSIHLSRRVSIVSDIILYNIRCEGINDILAKSLFLFLKVTSCPFKLLDLSPLSQFVIHSDVCFVLEEVLEHNRYIKELQLCCTENDSVVKAVTKGLRKNRNIHKLVIKNWSQISDPSLSSLINSISHDSLIMSIARDSLCLTNPECKDISGSDVHYCEAEFLEFLLEKLKTYFIDKSCQLKKLEISVSACYTLSCEAICSCLSIKTLSSLKFHNHLSVEVINCLASGLQGNTTLRCLSVKSCVFDYSIKPILLVLNSSGIDKFEVVNNFLLFRDHGHLKWKFQVIHLPLHCFIVIYSLLMETKLDINKIVQFSDLASLRISKDSVLTKTVLRSITDGCYGVKELILTFDDCISDPHSYGVAIQEMLTSSNNMCLKKLKIEDFANDTIAEHVVDGLSKSTTLLDVAVSQNERQYVQHSSFIHKLLGAPFLSSTICRVSICNISLQRKDIQQFELLLDGYDDNRIIRSNAISWEVIRADGRILFALLCILNCMQHSIDPSSLGMHILRTLKTLNFGSCQLDSNDLAFLFRFLQNNDTIVKLDVSHTIKTFPAEEESIYSELQGMFVENKCLKILNLTGIVDEKIATILATELYRCPLVSLWVDFNTKRCTFEAFEKLICAFVQSNLCHLHIENLCSIHVQRALSHKSNSGNCTVTVAFSVSPPCASSMHSELLHSWSLLFVLVAINKSECATGLALTVDGELNSSILPKVFHLFFKSCRSTKHQSTTVSEFNAAEYIIHCVDELHLDVTRYSSKLFGSIISALHHSSSLKEIYLYHDSVCAQDEVLPQLYETFFGSSEMPLQTVSFDGSFSDELANAVATGINHCTTLKTLRFRAIKLTIETLTQLLLSVFESSVTFVHIFEGCSLKRVERHQPFDVEFTGDKLLLCKLYYASAQVMQKNSRFLKSDSFLSGKELDASYNRERDVNDISYALKSTIDGFVSILHLSRNEITGFKWHLLLSTTSVLEELHMDECCITDDECERIAYALEANKCLRVLDLSYSDITCYGAELVLQSLTKNDTLQILDMSENSSTEGKSFRSDTQGNARKKCENRSLLKLYLGMYSTLYLKVSSVCRFISLKVLSLQIIRESVLVEVLNSLILSTPALEELNISNSSVQNLSTVIAVKQLIEHNHNYPIKVLNMSHCGINSESCTILATGLAENEHMKQLDLSGNEICGHGIIALFGVLETNTSALSEMNISASESYYTHDDVSHDDIEEAAILSTNSTLTTLKVANFSSDFSEWFGGRLFDGLKRNTTLHTLDIGGNDVAPNVFNVFVSMLSSNTSLVELDLTNTTFPEWNNDLANALLKCSSLEKVKVDEEMYESLIHQNEAIRQTLSLVTEF